jgi:hypothetical protein
MLCDKFRQPKIYFNNELVPEDHFNSLVGFLRNYISELFTHDEAFTLKEYLENNGHYNVQIEEIIEAPISKNYALINEDLLSDHVGFYEVFCEKMTHIKLSNISNSKLNVTGTYIVNEDCALDFLEEYVEKCVEEVDWTSIAKHKLSEGFIRKYADRVDWETISRYQSLSESFIEEFSDRIDWYSLRSPINVVEKFIESLDMIGLSQVNWLAINKLNLSDRFRAKFNDRLKYFFPASARYHPSYESYEDWQEPDYEYEALKEELIDDIEADREDHARSDEEGWYYDD